MLGFIFIYYVIFSFANYVLLCVCRSWMCLTDHVMTYLVSSLSINSESSIPGLRMMHHGFGNLEEIVLA